jgi:hypothetical protein
VGGDSRPLGGKYPLVAGWCKLDIDVFVDGYMLRGECLFAPKHGIHQMFVFGDLLSFSILTQPDGMSQLYFDAPIAHTLGNLFLGFEQPPPNPPQKEFLVVLF